MGDDTPDAPEATGEKRAAELERVLGQGAALPPNRPRGILGEAGLDARKVDDGGPSLFGGITQDWEPSTVWLAMLVAYFLFFPAAFVILWGERRFSLQMKIGYSAVFAAGVGAVAYALFAR